MRIAAAVVATLVITAHGIGQTRSEAEGCAATTLACGATARGRLPAGDCTLSSDGTFFDVYKFAGTAGQFVIIDVRPLSPTLTNPTLFLVPPQGDASKTPLIAGPGGGVSVAYLLSSTGTWSIAVGTADLFASGDYFISVRCFDDPSPGEAQNCTTQALLCGQAGAWSLTSQSCRFGNNSNRLYAAFQIYAVAGDLFTIEEKSNDFPPLFGVYDSQSTLIASASSTTNTTATLGWVAPSTGFYDILATSADDLKTGSFTLSVNCSRSGCLEPLALSQPANVSVPYGGRASLTFDVNASEPLTVSWSEFLPNLGAFIGNGRTVLTPPLFGTTSYLATATNACGTATSNTVLVTVQPPRVHAVRH